VKSFAVTKDLFIFLNIKGKVQNFLLAGEGVIKQQM
jgi:hypothetical protein